MVAVLLHTVLDLAEQVQPVLALLRRFSRTRFVLGFPQLFVTLHVPLLVARILHTVLDLVEQAQLVFCTATSISRGRCVQLAFLNCL